MTLFFFFFNDTSSTKIYTLSLHDALPISATAAGPGKPASGAEGCRAGSGASDWAWSCASGRSEEHTSELQSRRDLVCRLLLEKKKNRSGKLITRAPDRPAIQTTRDRAGRG